MSKIASIPSRIGRRVIGTWSQNLDVKLSDEEKNHAGIRAAELTCEIARIEEEKKSAMAEFKERLTKPTLDRDVEARAATVGRAYRDVEVTEEYDSIEDEVFRIRQDTGEILSRRKPTDSERQDSLPFGDA